MNIGIEKTNGTTFEALAFSAGSHVVPCKELIKMCRINEGRTYPSLETDSEIVKKVCDYITAGGKIDDFIEALDKAAFQNRNIKIHIFYTLQDGFIHNRTEHARLSGNIKEPLQSRLKTILEGRGIKASQLDEEFLNIVTYYCFQSRILYPLRHKAAEIEAILRDPDAARSPEEAAADRERRDHEKRFPCPEHISGKYSYECSNLREAISKSKGEARSYCYTTLLRSNVRDAHLELLAEIVESEI